MRPLLQTYVADFDARRYWEAHEHLETLWRGDHNPIWQGLIQVAAVFVHIDACRWGGASRVLTRALARLEAASPGDELDLPRLCVELRGLLEHLYCVQRDPSATFDERFRIRMAEYVLRLPDTARSHGSEEPTRGS